MIQDIMGDYTEQGMGDAHQDVMETILQRRCRI